MGVAKMTSFVTLASLLVLMTCAGIAAYSPPLPDDVQACYDKAGDLSRFLQIFSGAVPRNELPAACGRAGVFKSCIADIGAPADLAAFFDYNCREGTTEEYLESAKCCMDYGTELVMLGTKCMHAMLPPSDTEEDCTYFQDKLTCYSTHLKTFCGAAAARYVEPFTRQIAATEGVFNCNLEEYSVFAIAASS